MPVGAAVTASVLGTLAAPSSTAGVAGVDSGAFAAGGGAFFYKDKHSTIQAKR